MRQQRLLSRLPRLGEQSAPVAIRRSYEAPRHVVAEKRNFRDVGSILDLLFSEYPNVVWWPKRMPGRSMLSCAPKSA